MALPAIAALCYSQELLQRWDLLIYDQQIRSSYRDPDHRIAIVAIDEHSLARIGRWPWSRRTHAALIDQLTAAGARVIGMDIIFAEPDSAHPADDAALAGAVARHGKVVLPVFPQAARKGDRLSPCLPFSSLAKSAGRLGHVDVALSDDGVARGVSLVAGMGSLSWQTLALAMIGLGESDPGRYLSPVQRDEIQASRPDAWFRGKPILVPFAGPPGTFQQRSYSDLIAREDLASELRGKYILIGMTATGLGSRFSTPASAQSQPMSGVEFNANVLDALLNGLVVRPIPMAAGMLLTVILVLAPLLTYSDPRTRWALPVTLLFCVFTVGVSLILLKTLHLWYPPATAVATLIIGYPLWSWRRLEETAQRLHEEKLKATATLNAVGDAVIATDPRGSIVYMNPIAEHLSGYSSREAVGHPLELIVSPSAQDQSDDDCLHAIRRCLEDGCAFCNSKPFFLVNRLGQELAVRISANPTKAAGGRLTGMVVALSDVTETLKISREVSFLASHDPLTQLPNKSLLQDRLQQAIFRATRNQDQFAVLFVDLDAFKKVNDGLGHVVGDQVLKEAAGRLLASVRRSDTTARWGGDEFVILIEQIGREEHAAHVAGKILSAMRQPLRIAAQEIFVTPSIGVSMFPKDAREAELLVARADSAMYRAKDSGGNRVAFFSENADAVARDRLELEMELHHALRRRNFEVYYQPQVEPRSRRIFGVEALLRWRHPHRGLISPAHFIPLAEATGLINPIGEWVIQTVCQQLRAWRDADLQQIVAAVNLSPRQFFQDDLREMVVGYLKEAEIEPNRFKIEITESLVLKNIDHIAETLNALHADGVTVSLDDFGTGYSSLSSLKRLPIDQIKIDKSFVQNVVDDAHDANICQAMIALAHSLHMSVVAEGVETRPQVDFFLERRCDGIQGYYFSRPLPAEEMTELLRRRQNRHC